jgi:hypothetical protein
MEERTAREKETGARKDIMNNAELKKLEKLHEEAEQSAAAFHAIAIRAEPGSETAKQFKKLADSAFDRAEKCYQSSIEAYKTSKWHKPD